MRHSWLQIASGLVPAAAVSVTIACSTSGPLSTGSLAITIVGPPGVPAVVTVDGPHAFHQTIASTTTLANLRPGVYAIEPISVVDSGTTYGADTTTETVVASSTPATASVTYRAALEITSASLPTGTVGAPYGIAAVPAGTEDKCSTSSPANCRPCASAAACAGLQVCIIQATPTRPVVTNPPCVTSDPGSPFRNIVFAATGGLPPYDWSARSLPVGLYLDPLSGVVTGISTRPGTSTTTVTMTDSATPPDSSTAIYQIVIAP
jgi:hypothetical protein